MEQILKDGHRLQFKEFKVGNQIFIITTQGAIEMPDGKWETQDGSVFDSKNGYITDIVSPTLMRKINMIKQFPKK